MAKCVYYTQILLPAKLVSLNKNFKTSNNSSWFWRLRLKKQKQCKLQNYSLLLFREMCIQVTHNLKLDFDVTANVSWPHLACRFTTWNSWSHHQAHSGRILAGENTRWPNRFRGNIQSGCHCVRVVTQPRRKEKDAPDKWPLVVGSNYRTLLEAKAEVTRAWARARKHPRVTVTQEPVVHIPSHTNSW